MLEDDRFPGFPQKKETHHVSFDKEDVKSGIDKAAEHLKAATDAMATKSHEASESAKERAKELARKTGDQLIAQGERLKEAAR
jgi:hypothetical protein